MSSPHPTLRASPQKKSKSVSVGKQSPKQRTQPLPKPVEATDDDVDQGALAGPSSPSRRRRRPSASRRRSSSITAAASLISSYSKSPSDRTSKNAVGLQSTDEEDGSDDDDRGNERRRGAGNGKRPYMSRKGTSDVPFGGGATETFYDARHALGGGVPSPFHMALLTLLGSLAQGMPLASMFKVYSYTMCRIYQDRHVSLVPLISLPPAPELPSSPLCNDSWVQKATSTYAAAMATVGALLGLVLLERCSRLSNRFGRKPLMLFTHLALAVAFLFFRISVVLPTYVAAAVLYVAVMVLEASAGAPLRIAIQNYVVDTTSEAQRAGALSFIDGFGQLGAFPSTTLGGLLSVLTGNFFAPFYATVAIYCAAFGYVLVFVPESKKRRHHTLIDDWEHGATEEQDGQPKAGSEQGSAIDSREGHQSRLSYSSTAPSEQSAGDTSRLRRLVRRLNFLAPLSVFLPKKTDSGGLDCRLFNLAMIVIFEESFQVFFVPILLLYNSEVFHFDVVQNGYLVSLLQGTRALFLTLIFPPFVAKAREWIGRRHESRKARQGQGAEESPLLSGTSERQYVPPPTPGGEVEARDMAAEEDDGASSVQGQKQKAAKREDRGKLDIIVMLVSYLLAMASFLLLCTTRSQKESKTNRVPAWVGIAVSIVGLQLGSGATSVRTALIVNAVGQEEEQSQALAANQILCTGIYAVVPLVTSAIFGWGLQMGRPEIVWTFKAVMAGLAAVSTLVLFCSYRKHPTQGQ